MTHHKWRREKLNKWKIETNNNLPQMVLHWQQLSAVLKVVLKSWGLPLTTYPFPLSPPSIYHPTTPELEAELTAGAWALLPQPHLL